MRRPHDPAADLMLLATTFLWALNFSVSKYLLDKGLHPLSYSALRYTAAGAIFVVLTLAIERSLSVERRDWPLLAGATIVLLGNQLSFVYSLRFTTAATAALIFGTLPIFTALIARLVGLERLINRFWIGAGISFAGVALVAGGSGGGLSANVKGDALAVLGAVTWGAYSVAIAPLMRRYSPMRLSAVLLPAVSVPLAALSIGQLRVQSFDFGALFWAGFAFSIIGPLVLSNLMWFSAIDRVGPSHAALFANLQPFLAAAVALVLLSERITALQIAGGAAIAAGILISRRRRAPERPPPYPPSPPAGRDGFGAPTRATRALLRGTLAAGRRLRGPRGSETSRRARSR